MDYEKILDDTRRNLIDSIVKDLSNPDFNWNQLINLILEEESPLPAVFSEKTVRLADACEAADRLYHSYKEIEEDKESEDVERSR